MSIRIVRRPAVPKKEQDAIVDMIHEAITEVRRNEVTCGVDNQTLTRTIQGFSVTTVLRGKDLFNFNSMLRILSDGTIARMVRYSFNNGVVPVIHKIEKIFPNWRKEVITEEQMEEEGLSPLSLVCGESRQCFGYLLAHSNRNNWMHGDHLMSQLRGAKVRRTNSKVVLEAAFEDGTINEQYLMEGRVLLNGTIKSLTSE